MFSTFFLFMGINVFSESLSSLLLFRFLKKFTVLSSRRPVFRRCRACESKLAPLVALLLQVRSADRKVLLSRFTVPVSCLVQELFTQK